MRVLSTVALTTVLFACCLMAPAKTGGQNHCDEKQDRWLHQANPKSWTALYHLFKEFGQCDDGAIGEGFSEDVAQLLLKQWTHLDVLNDLMRSDSSFRKFVLLHIDSTLDEGELKGIVNNAKARCPAWGAHFCRSVEIKARHSLEELN